MSITFRMPITLANFRRGWLFTLMVWLLGTTAMPMRAQGYLGAAGVPPFTAKIPVENGFINAANGNLHLEIPLGDFPHQRGGDEYKVVLMYDSAIWLDNGYEWVPYNISSTGTGSANGATPSEIGYAYGGWRLVTSGAPTTYSYGETDSGWCSHYSDYRVATYSNWLWTGPDGTQHWFYPGTTSEAIYPDLPPEN